MDATWLNLNAALGLGYKGPTQRVRRISEDWISTNGYCLNCSCDTLSPTKANTRTRDFVCLSCNHGYELKSKCGSFGKSIVDGSYPAMVRTIREGTTPSFLLLEYAKSWSILGLTAIHHSLITENAIQPRKPLSPSARRAGWIGCNIILSTIAIQGRIPIVAHGSLCSKEESRISFGKLESLSVLSSAERTWAATILRMTDRFEGEQFSLADMYQFESELKAIFPNNHHVRPKIRQQLQLLRDAKLLTFHGGATYERIDSN